MPVDWIHQQQRDGIIEHAGYIDDMPGMLGCTDLLAFPSYYREGAPRIVLEAAACGVPTVGADVPGTRDLIDDGRTGFLVPMKNVQELAQRIEELLSKPELRQKLGAAARQKVHDEFEIGVVTDRQLDIYRELGLEVDVKA